MPERINRPSKNESSSSPENHTREEKIKELIALAKELSESQESFAVPGIDPEADSRIRATETEFPGYTTPLDTLLDRFRSEGMRVTLGQYPESGNVYVVPAGGSDTPNEDMYIFPRHLQINDMMNPKIRSLIQMHKDRFRPRS